MGMVFRSGAPVFQALKPIFLKSLDERRHVRPGYFEDSCYACLLYTSDAADERSSVDLGGRRIIKKKISVRDSKRSDWLKN